MGARAFLLSYFIFLLGHPYNSVDSDNAVGSRGLRNKPPPNLQTRSCPTERTP